MSRSISIAILLNGYDSPYKPGIRNSFQQALAAATSPTPSPSIDFYDPIIAQIYPDPSKYDLIVLSGGTEDPMGSAPWVLKLQDYLQRTILDYPQQKILGICWGHQTICVTLGGEVGSMEEAEVGVTEIRLTAEGDQVFSFAQGRPLRMHEFHKRDIKVPAKGFKRLAEANQSFVNETNTILTFQGHPELNTELATTMLLALPSYMDVEADRRDALLNSVGSAHDGVELWRRILAWVKE